MCGGTRGSRPTGHFVGQGPRALPGARCVVGGRTEASAPTEGLTIEFRRGRCPHRPASVTRGAVREESPSHGFAVPAPFRQGGREDEGTDCHSQCAHWLRNDRGFCKGCGKAGRCGERIERRRWRMKRDERVAAVKISSDSRKAAQKFWAPQQGHRPLRKVTREYGANPGGRTGYWWCGGERCKKGSAEGGTS